jgi:hypothetical protein
MKDVEKNQDSGAKKKEQDLTYLRGYCRVCNRHYFYRNNLDTGHLQFRQHAITPAPQLIPKNAFNYDY